MILYQPIIIKEIPRKGSAAGANILAPDRNQKSDSAFQ